MSRWLWVAYPLAFIGVSAVWGGVVQVLLGTQVATMVGPDNAPATLGIVSAVAAVSSVLSQPVMGLLNDRTRSRFGRRNIWVLGASIVSAGALLGTAVSPSVPVLAVVWALAIWPLNALQGALGAVLPERIPVRLRGSVSGLLGAASFGGSFIGIAIAGLSGNVFVGYAGIAVVVLATAVLFAFTTEDYTPPARRTGPLRPRRGAIAPGFRAAPDYWWTFAGRFSMIFGASLVAGFQLYILQNYIGVGDGSLGAAATALVGLSGISALTTIVFALLGGWISDRFERLRIFVGLSTLMFIPVALVYLFVPTYQGAVIASVITGVGYGTYLAVDQALISRVLPSNENAARDLGIMNIANAGPQILAPVLGGLLVTVTGDYRTLFVVMIVAVIVSSVFVTFVRSVR
ncbi:MFS transporter [Rathayibacter sp. VKM Ac-2856]|uniref:MFS transporter n=1 Tax=unclassified Rathayibacter TaxID=2609250 RepID=UPI001564AB6B|nr:MULTISPECIES: MFS transporter [unclassified Rathayibacter]NQX03185.1 MFS transporter [Rathayibacter sp. VKM Ac-2858]NQX18353.1 MFS transporter [Rathayibacter sp. VKM Ac-2856]